MNHRLLCGCLAVLGVAVASHARAADAPKQPERPNPGAFFERLDKNNDGKVTADELPAGLPERVKNEWTNADQNGDKAVTRDEWNQFIAKRREGRERDRTAENKQREEREKRAEAERREVREKRAEAERREAREKRPGPMPVPPPGRPFGRPWEMPGPGMAPIAPPAIPPLDAKALFEKLDTDKNGSLSRDEFAAGMERVHREAVERHQQAVRAMMEQQQRRGAEWQRRMSESQNLDRGRLRALVSELVREELARAGVVKQTPPPQAHHGRDAAEAEKRHDRERAADVKHNHKPLDPPVQKKDGDKKDEPKHRHDAPKDDVKKDPPKKDGEKK